jgi:RNA polymerase sigma-70 factor (ECF subfamily)
VKDREDAMDLSQDVFLKAHQNLGKLEDAGRFGPWLFRIAHNEAFSLLRRNRPEIGLESHIEGESWGGSAVGRRMLPVEVSLAVERALATLSEDQREAVVLKIYQGFKFEEMAEILGCPVSTIKSRLYTALENLKTTLAPIHMRGVE